MSTRRGFSPWRDIPTALWLAAVPAVAAAGSMVPTPRWLMIHLLLLGAVTHSILVWSRHFADALLHTPTRPNDGRQQRVRLVILNLGVLFVVVGLPLGWWPLTAMGAGAVALAVVWHGAALLRQLRRSRASRFAVTVHYHVAAACLLPIGAALGAGLARGTPEKVQVRLMIAHVVLNVLGWMGLTILGTLVILWPTMLRTRIVEGVEATARRALPILLAGVLLAVAGGLAGVPSVVAVGLAGYLAGLGVLGHYFYRAARTKPPAGYPTWSVLAGLVWLVLLVALLAVECATTSSVATLHERWEPVMLGLAAGFGAQVLLGAQSYLVPVALGGGPAAVRAANTELNRGGALRVALINAALPICLLPTPPEARRLAWMLVLGSLVSFVPLMFSAILVARKAKARVLRRPSVSDDTRPDPASIADEPPR